MVSRTALLTAGVLAAGFAVFHAIADVEVAPVPLEGVAITVSSVPVDLRSADPADRRIGKLIYRGGISLVPADERFGGLSGFKVSADGARFVAVSDIGNWTTGSLQYDARGDLNGAGDIAVSPLLDAEGMPLHGKDDGDAEGLAFRDPSGLAGDAFVSFERNHRVLRYAFAADGMKAKGVPVPMPEAIKDLRNNSGLEVLSSLADGRILAIAEEGPKDENDDSPGWVVDPGSGAAVRFTMKRVLPFSLTDATVLPDGRVLVLERRFDVLTGPGAELRAYDPAIFTEGATVDGELIAALFAGVTVDNMEGLAARKSADGKTLIYVVSDDNFQRPLQRTLIMMFELAE
jgi:hypothetical protein